MPTEIQATDQTAEIDQDRKRKTLPSWLGGTTVTVMIILSSTALVFLFAEDLEAYGLSLMTRYGQNWIDLILLLITAVSCTPLVLPVWGYAVLGVTMGYNVYRLAIVMAMGSAIGSFVTYMLGRFFAERKWVKKKFPNILTNKWTTGRSRTYVALAILIGTASPIPCDVLYAAAGAKHFPVWLFYLTTFGGRFVRYLYLGLGAQYALGWL